MTKAGKINDRPLLLFPNLKFVIVFKQILYAIDKVRDIYFFILIFVIPV